MTDTEDPNIATLREALDELRSRRPGCPDPTCGLCKRFNAEDAETDAALARLASTLAERDRRIAEQQSLLRRFLALTFEGTMAEIDAEELERALGLVGEYVPYAGSMSESEWQAYANALSLAMEAAEAHLAHLRAPKGELEEARAELTRETIAAALKEGFDFWVDNESDGRNAFEMYADVVLRLIAGLKSNEAEWRDLAVGLSESLTANAPFTLGPQRDQHRKLAERVWAELPGNRDGDLTVLKAAFLLVAQAALSRAQGEGT